MFGGSIGRTRDRRQSNVWQRRWGEGSFDQVDIVQTLRHHRQPAANAASVSDPSAIVMVLLGLAGALRRAAIGAA